MVETGRLIIADAKKLAEQRNKLAEHRRIVRYEDLHPAVRKEVDRVKATRRMRIAVPLVAGGTLLPLNLFRAAEPAQNIGLPVIAAVSYKSYSPEVRRHSAYVGDAIRNAGAVDAEKKVRPDEARKTHPYFYIGKGGDIILLPINSVENAVAKAQQTKLKHILPARYRVKL